MKKNRNASRIKKHIKIRKKISGTKQIPRVNVFKSLRHFEAQLVDDTKGHTLVQNSTLKLKLKNGGNLAAAKQLGAAFADQVLAQGIKRIVFDRSGYIYHGRVKVFAEILREKGVKF